MTDTIYIAIKDTIFSQQQIIDAYRDLIQSQQSTYIILIVILLALLGANIFANYFFSKRRLKTEVEDVFREEEKNIHKDLKSYIDGSIKEHIEETEMQLKYMQAETYRLFAISARNDKLLTRSFDYFVSAISLYEESGNQKLARICAKQSLILLDFFVKNGENSWGEYLSNIRDCKDLMKLLEKFPDYLFEEKQKILKLIPKQNNDNKGKTEIKPE